MKKRIIGFLLALVLLLACASPAALAESDGWVKLASADGSLHLRKGPAKTYASAGYVKHGDAVDVSFGITGTDSDGEQWTHITVQRTGQSGYIKTKYISSTPVGNTSTGPVVSISGGGSLHVRKGPGTDFGSAGYVSHGQSISILSEGATWTKIRVTASGVTGYIKNKYIIGLSSANGPSAAPAATAYRLGSVMTKTAGGKVNIRTGAGTGYSSVGKLGRGEGLRIYGESGNWFNIVADNGLSGWISKNYVALGVNGRTTANVNCRTGAGTGYGILRSLPKGTAVVLHSVTGNWAKVTAGATDGYVSMTYLHID